MIAVQTAIGDIGGKATTILTQSYLSMINAGKFQYGVNENGLYLLNQGTVAPSFSLFTSDLAVVRKKQFRCLYVTLDSAISKVITLSVTVDGGTTHTYTQTTTVAGVQRVRFPISSKIRSVGWKFGLSSPSWFEIHQADPVYLVPAE